jgi:hypothetical protein
MFRTRTLVLAIAAVLLAACSGIPREPHEEAYGVVTTFPANIPGYIYPARISVIDGKNVSIHDPRTTFRLRPGTHTVQIVADLSDATSKVRSVHTPKSEQPGKVEIFVEAGRRYHVGAYFRSGHADTWEARVWKVEDIDNYDHSITRM